MSLPYSLPGITELLLKQNYWRTGFPTQMLATLREQIAR